MLPAPRTDVRHDAPTTPPSWWQQSLTARVDAALPAASQTFGAHVTDGRETTIGGSDIGSCPRKVVLAKRHGVEHDPATYWRFLRGHTREISLAAIYDEMASIRDGSCRSTSQVRIVHPDDPRKRVHPDRILHEGPTLEESHFVQVIEEKCPDSVPEAPWDGWVYQLQWAMGLSQLAYPAAQVNGVLFASDLAGNRTDFGTLWKPNPAVFRELQEKADGLLNHMAAGSTPDPEPDLLCGHCRFVEGCPAYADPLEVPLSDELVGAVHRLRDLAKAKKRVLGEYGAAKKRVLAALFPRGLPRSSWKKELGGVPTSFYWGAGRRETHYGRLAEAFPEAYAACVTEGKPYPVLRTR